MRYISGYALCRGGSTGFMNYAGMASEDGKYLVTPLVLK